MRQLDDTQLEAFDTEYMDDARWRAVRKSIDRDFPNGTFTFLDVGGGTGRLADRLLGEYPNAKGVVLDNSELLLSKNTPNERKKLLLSSVEDLGKITGRFDIVFANWLLHHLVGESYAQTRRNQAMALKTFTALLTVRGRISVYENNYDGIVIDGLPGWLIYQFSSSRLMAPIAMRFGANTAGVGVCFLSKRQWLSAMSASSLELLESAEPDSWSWSMPLQQRLPLHIRRRYVSHFWLMPKGQNLRA